MVFELPSVKKRCKPLKPKPSRLYRNPIALAQEWQRALANGDYSSPADLSRKLGVSRARVTQVLQVLRIVPEVRKALAALGDPLASPIVTERRLRSVVNLPPEEQGRRIDAILRNSRTQQT